MSTEYDAKNDFRYVARDIQVLRRTNMALSINRVLSRIPFALCHAVNTMETRSRPWGAEKRIELFIIGPRISYSDGNTR